MAQEDHGRECSHFARTTRDPGESMLDSHALAITPISKFKTKFVEHFSILKRHVYAFDIQLKLRLNEWLHSSLITKYWPRFGPGS